MLSTFINCFAVEHQQGIISEHFSAALGRFGGGATHSTFDLWPIYCTELPGGGRRSRAQIVAPASTQWWHSIVRGK